MWARAKRGKDGVRPGQKESARWIEGYERVAEMAATLPGTWLEYQADREADMVALMRRARDLVTPADWLVRATHNRSVDDGEKLWEHTCSGTALGKSASPCRPAKIRGRVLCANNCGPGTSRLPTAKADAWA